MKKLIAWVLACVAFAASAGEVSIVGGVARADKPDDGIYYNSNQPHDVRLTPPFIGLRYDADWWAVQYTAFGTFETNAVAVTADAPAQGGYIANTGTCVGGTCAPTARWKMYSDVQCLAGLLKYRWTQDVTLEGGVNLCEIKTWGHVEYSPPDPQPWYNYPHGRTLDLGPVIGLQYRVDNEWAVLAQYMRIEGRGDNGGNGTPANFREHGTWLLGLKYIWR